MKQSLPPAQLWLGAHQQLIKYVQEYLQKIFCKNNGCTTCKTCSLITEQQYHATTWLYPEKNYTLSSLEPITKTVSFALEKGHHYFFIIQKADFLSVLCQNMLLKTIEEPPAGYHFILLAERKEHILPTIQSRCRTKTWNTKAATHDTHSLVQFFTQQIRSAHGVLDELNKNCPHERETIEILDAIISYWLQLHAQTDLPVEQQENIQKKLRLLLHAQKQPPMPGSSKLFWRNLFLQWQG